MNSIHQMPSNDQITAIMHNSPPFYVNDTKMPVDYQVPDKTQKSK